MEIKDILDRIGQMFNGMSLAIHAVSSAIRERNLIEAAKNNLSYPHPKYSMFGTVMYYEPVYRVPEPTEKPPIPKKSGSFVG